MWKEKYYFAFVVFLSFLFLINPIHAISLQRGSGNVGFYDLPTTGLHFDANGLEKK